MPTARTIATENGKIQYALLGAIKKTGTNGDISHGVSAFLFNFDIIKAPLVVLYIYNLLYFFKISKCFCFV